MTLQSNADSRIIKSMWRRWKFTSIRRLEAIPKMLLIYFNIYDMSEYI